MRTATNATSIVIQKTIGRAKLMFDSYRRRRSVSCIHLQKQAANVSFVPKADMDQVFDHNVDGGK